MINLQTRDTCEADNEYNNEYMGARISAIFVILVTSSFGVFLPVLSSRYSFIKMPPPVFFAAKYFGTGVIVATAFIHLLEPANDNLSNECLGGTFEDYPWAYGIALMSLFVLFFFELASFNMVDRKIANESTGHSHSHFGDEEMYLLKKISNEDLEEDDDQNKQEGSNENTHNHSHSGPSSESQRQNPYPDHFLHAIEHQDPELLNTPVSDVDKEHYYGQLVSTFVLEFGIIFHSVFIGLSLAVSGEEFKTLYIVLVFHQMFEGLGLGTRIASTAWPANRKWLPYVFGVCYGLTTPIAIAIGLGVRNSYAPGSRKALITNGVFDAISAGILIYAGIVELMAHEFLYSGQFKGKGGTKRMFLAYVTVCVGCGLMALLGRWA